LSDLTIEDFAFVRGVIGGMAPMVAFKRFYALRDLDPEGVPLCPHGHTVNALAPSLLKRILAASLGSANPLVRASAEALQLAQAPPPVTETQKAQAHMSFTEWADAQPVDMWSEADLLEAYESYVLDQGAPGDQVEVTAAVEIISDSQQIKAKVKALNFLQTQLASAPARGSPISVWLSPALAPRLAALKVATLGQLCDFISLHGRHWADQVHKLGPVLTQRLEKWLDAQEGLGGINRAAPNWHASPPLKSILTALERAPTVVPLVYESGSTVATPRAHTFARRCGVAPLELLDVPAHLDGSSGMYRSSAPNHLGAKNDYDAVRLWLATFHSAGKLRTFDAYRREIERFYLWCLLEMNVPLSGVSLAHGMAYQAFLRAIPEHYISTARVTRDDPRWRPWRGQLDEASQAYALNVVSQCFTALWKNSYLTGNPLTSLKSVHTKTRAMDTSRALSRADLLWLRESLDDLPGLESTNLTRAALARRTRLILHLLLTTGMRREEVATARFARLEKAVVGGAEQDDEWLLPVVGKGKKERKVPLSGAVVRMIREHHEDAVRIRRLSTDKGVEKRVAAVDADPPLICSLQAPVRKGSRLIDDSAVMAGDNGALGRVGLYKTLKTFIRAHSLPHLVEAKWNLADCKARLDHAAKCDDLAALPSLRASVADLALEVATWTRRSAVSTHWMRHTFALAVLLANPKDEGLKITQQLLGHASITTTAGYLQQDNGVKVEAVRGINPLGD
jgi:site-specific recombinase XerD